MRLLIILFSLTLIYVSAHSIHHEEYPSFATYVKLYHKQYRNAAEYEHHHTAYNHHIEHFKKINADPTLTYRVGVNEFTDISSHTFHSTKTMSPRRAPIHPPERYAERLSVENLPTSFDWRQSKSPVVVGPVRDQGTVGTCWAFSTMENVAGQWARHTGTYTDLSVEQLVDCDATAASSGTHADCGVFGGWPDLAYQYIIASGGLTREVDYPYCCGLGTCYPCMAQGSSSNCGPGPYYCNITQNHCTGLKPFATISNWTAIGLDEDQIAAQLISRGPLSILIDSTNLQSYTSGIWNPSDCSTTDLDHAVLVVGYGDGYWIVKNSWGSSWGLSGYFYLAKGVNRCGIATACTSSVV